MFNSNQLLAGGSRRVQKSLEDQASTNVTGTAYNGHQDENLNAGRGNGREKLGLLGESNLAAGNGAKLGAAPRRAILGNVSNTGQVGSNLVNVNSIIGGGAVRNLRAKTVQQSIVVKGKETSVIGGDLNASLATRTSAFIDPADKENIAPEQPVYRYVQPSKPVIVQQDWDDLDAEDAGDPLMVSDYVVEIFDYMRNIEKSIIPDKEYMTNQKELSWHMRSILVDWLIEVQWKLKLLPETLYLSINLIDRFLSRRAVSLVKLQLVGLAATLIASKYEEVLSPSIANFIFLADNAYADQELLKAERYMLHVLNYSLAYPSPLTYLRRISKADNYDLRTRTLAKYLMEITLLDAGFVNVAPSMVAAVGMYVSRLMLKSGEWNANLTHYSGYSETEIKPHSHALLLFLQRDQQYSAIHKKYASKKFMKASIYVHDWIKRHYPSCPAALAAFVGDASAANSPA